MKCPECHRPVLKPGPSHEFEGVFTVIAFLWAVLGVMAAGGIVEALMSTHWLTFLVTLTVYGLGTTILVLWWKIKTL